MVRLPRNPVVSGKNSVDPPVDPVEVSETWQNHLLGYNRPWESDSARALNRPMPVLVDLRFLDPSQLIGLLDDKLRSLEKAI